MLVKPLIKPCYLNLSFTICPSFPSNLYRSHAKRAFSDFPTFVIAGLPYVKAIPSNPPDLLLMSKFSYNLHFPISCVRSAERPPPKPPDLEVAMLPIFLGCVLSLLLFLCLLLALRTMCDLGVCVGGGGGNEFLFALAFSKQRKILKKFLHACNCCERFHCSRLRGVCHVMDNFFAFVV